MRTLNKLSVRTSLVDRLERLTPTTAPRWGVMSSTQMLQHLTLAFQMSLGEGFGPSSSSRRFDHPIYRLVALSLPVRWPKGIAAPPELDFSINPPPPAQFRQVQDDVICAMHSFGQARSSAFVSGHPMFGTLSYEQWMRWGFRHVDHHLRQFGC